MQRVQLKIDVRSDEPTWTPTRQDLWRRIEQHDFEPDTPLNFTRRLARDHGWSLEVAIPWSSFADLADNPVPKIGDRWIANMNRWDGTEPNRRLSQWSDSGLVKPDPHYPDRFGHLLFVE